MDGDAMRFQMLTQYSSNLAIEQRHHLILQLDQSLSVWFRSSLDRAGSPDRRLVDNIESVLQRTAYRNVESILQIARTGTDEQRAKAEFAAAKPIYESMPGWDEDISQVHDFNDLPKTCQDYVKRLEELSGCRISVIGTGPQRDHIIQINSLID